MTTREQIAVCMSKYALDSALEANHHGEPVDIVGRVKEILDISIKSPEARDYWLDKAIEAVYRELGWRTDAMNISRSCQNAAIKAIEALKEAQSDESHENKII